MSLTRHCLPAPIATRSPWGACRNVSAVQSRSRISCLGALRVLRYSLPMYFRRRDFHRFLHESLCCRIGHWRVLHVQSSPSVHSILVSSVFHQSMWRYVCSIAQCREQVPRKSRVVSRLSDPSPLQCDLEHVILLLRFPLQCDSQVRTLSDIISLICVNFTYPPAFMLALS